MLRKPGKLPSGTSQNPSVFTASYEMEYASNQLQISKCAFDLCDTQHPPCVVVVDDVLATGATAVAASRLVKLARAALLEVAVLIELTAHPLDGRRILQQSLDVPLFSLLKISTN